MPATWKVVSPDGSLYAEGTTKTTVGALMQGLIGGFFARRAWKKQAGGGG